MSVVGKPWSDPFAPSGADRLIDRSHLIGAVNEPCGNQRSSEPTERKKLPTIGVTLSKFTSSDLAHAISFLRRLRSAALGQKLSVSNADICTAPAFRFQSTFSSRFFLAALAPFNHHYASICRDGVESGVALNGDERHAGV